MGFFEVIHQIIELDSRVLKLFDPRAHSAEGIDHFSEAVAKAVDRLIHPGVIQLVSKMPGDPAEPVKRVD